MFSTSRAKRLHIRTSRAGRYCLAAIAVTIALTPLSACSAASSHPISTSTVSAAPDHVFDGTPAEYATLARACMRNKGFVTKSADNPNGFAIDMRSHTFDEVSAATQECDAQLGAPKMANLTEQELKARYDSRIAQWNCLLAHKLVQGSPPTYAAFVDSYNRKGQKELWEPTDGASTIAANGKPVGPSNVCPRTTY